MVNYFFFRGRGCPPGFDPVMTWRGFIIPGNGAVTLCNEGSGRTTRAAPLHFVSIASVQSETHNSGIVVRSSIVSDEVKLCEQENFSFVFSVLISLQHQIKFLPTAQNADCDQGVLRSVAMLQLGRRETSD